MENLSDLVKKYADGNCSPEEVEILKYHFHFFEAHSEVEVSGETLYRIQENIWKKIIRQTSPSLNIWPKISIAAAILVFLTLALLFFSKNPDLREVKVANEDLIKPGKNGATLTLADGRVMLLGDNGEKSITFKGADVAKADSGQLIYKNSQKAFSGLNILSTGRGQQYTIVLPDETKIWLNSESRIDFHTDLNFQTIRQVNLRGEAYFEVSKNPKTPFIVKSARQTIKVLGTHFNVTDYSDEKLVKTTLVEGRVSVNSVNGKVILYPGEQSSTNDAGKIDVRRVNTRYATSWKDGMFVFDNEPLHVIMNKIARWYDLEIVFQSKDLMNVTFFGTISRAKDVSAVLNQLSLTKTVRFERDQRKIFVIKY